MKSDEKGFLYPIIDEEKCIDCGACRTVCQTYCDMPKLTNGQAYYKAVIRDEDILLNSQSGGMFTAISDYVLENGGVVYGAVLQGADKVIHKRAQSPEERDMMRGSKYIQSDLCDTFVNIRDDLNNGSLVLFSGTPCQCDGLKNFLNKTKTDTTKLLVVDLICHGVPSPLLWKDYVKHQERKYGGKIDKIIFRDKSFGWASNYESFWIKGKKYSCEEFKNLYCSNVCLRESCYMCKYSCLNRVGDVSIGDAWLKRGIHNHDILKGESLVIVNNAKGEKVFEMIKASINFQSVAISEYLQPQLITPPQSNDNAKQFWRVYRCFGYGYINFIFGKSGFINKVYKIIRRKIINIVSK